MSNKSSQTQINAILKKSSFNPRESSPLSVILESGNPAYFEQKAIEMLRLDLLKPIKKSEHLQNLQMVISLLVMSQCMLEEPKSTTKKPMTKTKPLMEGLPPT